MPQSKAELQFQLLLDDLKLDYVTQYKFLPNRKWRFDFAILDKKIAFEVDGGIYPTKEQLKRGASMGGSHARPQGILNDKEKDWLAKMEGWEVYRVPSQWMFHCERHKPQINLIPFERVKKNVLEFVARRASR